MTMHAIDYYPSGKILQQRSGLSLSKMHEFELMPIEAPIDTIDSKYVSDGVVVEMPPKPSEHHRFDYTTKHWIDPRTPDTEWPLVRAERDRRLLASDWTQLPDVPLATKEAWATYRQALRDITEQPDPFNITWPAVPG